MSACRISRQCLAAGCAARCRHGRLLKRLGARTGAQVYARLHRHPEHQIETEVDRLIRRSYKANREVKSKKDKL